MDKKSEKDFYKEYTGGLVKDNRKKEEKEKDFLTTILTTSGQKIDKKLIKNFKSFAEADRFYKKNYGILLRDQERSNSCVAQALANCMAVIVNRCFEGGTNLQFSATTIYKKRGQKEGMTFHEACEALRKYGVCQEIDYPSQKMTDEEIDNADIPEFQRHFAIQLTANKIKYFREAKLTFDKLRTHVGHYRAALIGYGTVDDYFGNQVPKLTNDETAFKQKNYHAVCCFDICKINGEEYAVVSDSAHRKEGGYPIRFLSKEFVNKRLIGLYVIASFAYNSTKTDIEKYLPFTSVKFGDKSDDVVNVQKFLQAFGWFPKNITTSGLYGKITAQAVSVFISEMVDKVKTDEERQGKYWGRKCIKVAKELVKIERKIDKEIKRGGM